MVFLLQQMLYMYTSTRVKYSPSCNFNATLLSFLSVNYTYALAAAAKPVAAAVAIHMCMCLTCCFYAVDRYKKLNFELNLNIEIKIYEYFFQM